MNHWFPKWDLSESCSKTGVDLRPNRKYLQDWLDDYQRECFSKKKKKCTLIQYSGQRFESLYWLKLFADSNTESNQEMNPGCGRNDSVIQLWINDQHRNKYDVMWFTDANVGSYVACSDRNDSLTVAPTHCMTKKWLSVLPETNL